MAYSAFLEKDHVPTESEVQDVLGPVAGFWSMLRARLAEGLGEMEADWTFSG